MLRKSTFLFLIFLLGTSINYGQIKLRVGGGLGYTIPQGDYSGSTIDYYNGNKFGLSNGYNFHAKGRVGLLALNVFGQIDYSSFSNDGESEPGKGKVELNQKITSFKVGPEFSLSLPLSPIDPYFAVYLIYSNISGETIFTGVPEVPSGTHSFESATRTGLGAGAGVEFDLNALMSLDFSVQYDLVNLFGKEYNQNGDNRIGSYLGLNDDKDPRFNSGSDDYFIGDSRSISALSIKVSLLFGL